MAADPIDPTRVREAVERTKDVLDHREEARAAGINQSRFHRDFDIRTLVVAALDALTQRDKVREQSEAMAGLQGNLTQWKEAAQAASDAGLVCAGMLGQLRSELEAERYANQQARVAGDEAIRGLQRELEAARAERDRLTKELVDAKEALGWVPDEVPPDVR